MRLKRDVRTNYRVGLKISTCQTIGVEFGEPYCHYRVHYHGWVQVKKIITTQIEPNEMDIYVNYFSFWELGGKS